MEATIRTNDSNAFNALIEFLKSLHFDIETNPKTIPTKKKKIKKIDEAIKFWNSYSIDMSNFKLNREDAYKR